MSSWRWSRSPGNVTSTCDACGAQITGRTDTQILRDQRGHDLAVCVDVQRQKRVAAAGVSRCIRTESDLVAGTIEGQGEAASSVTSKPPLGSPDDVSERIT